MRSSLALPFAMLLAVSVTLNCGDDSSPNGPANPPKNDAAAGVGGVAGSSGSSSGGTNGAGATGSGGEGGDRDGAAGTTDGSVDSSVGDVPASDAADSGGDAGSMEAGGDASTDGSAGTNGASGSAGTNGASGSAGAADSGPDAGDAGPSPCVVPLAGIVSHWHGDGDFADAYRTNSGTNAGSATFISGSVGRAINLSGAADAYANIPDSSSLDFSTAMTVDAWIHASALGGRIIDKSTAGGVDGYLLDTSGGKLRLLVGSNSVTSTAPLRTGEWTHVAGVYDGATMTVYVNGALAGSEPTTLASIPTNDLALRIGADSTGGTRFAGAVDEVRVFKRALGAPDIKVLYEAALARAGVVSWWHAEGDYLDAIGNNHGASAGTAQFGSGRIGQGFSLTGALHSYVQVPNAAAHQFTGAFTTEAWINATILGGRIVDKVTAFDVDGYLFDTYSSRLRLIVGYDTLYSTMRLSPRTWLHVAGVFNGTALRLFVNGVEVAAAGSDQTITPTNSLDLRFGADSLGRSLFSGTIDEVRLYGRALSDRDIKALYAESSCD
jgi:hypothetical protein